MIALGRHIGLPLHAFAFSEQIQASETENSNRRRLRSHEAICCNVKVVDVSEDTFP